MERGRTEALPRQLTRGRAHDAGATQAHGCGHGGPSTESYDPLRARMDVCAVTTANCACAVSEC